MKTRQREPLLSRSEAAALCRDRELAVAEAAATLRLRNEVGTTIAHPAGLRGDWLGDRGALIQGGWLADG